LSQKFRISLPDNAVSLLSDRIERERERERETASAVWWSEFLVTDPEVRGRFPALPEKKVVGLERGPLSLVTTTEELLDRKVAAPV
jgi:hypothetical protein